MKQRITIIAFLAVFVLACVALAQDVGPGQKMRGQDGALSRVAKELQLSKEQVRSIIGIVKQFHADAKEIFKSTATDEEKKTKIEALKQTAEQSILGVLNADQRAKAEKMNLVKILLSPRLAMLARVLAQLDLTDQQKTAIKAIVQESETKASAIREDSSLTPEAKQTKLRELKQDTLTQIKAELDATQLQKLEELMKNRPERGQRPGCRGGQQN
ncbi:MAG: hypothetical protein ACYC64_10975 [Armatimonadota bacterium]